MRGIIPKRVSGAEIVEVLSSGRETLATANVRFRRKCRELEAEYPPAISPPPVRFVGKTGIGTINVADLVLV